MSRDSLNTQISRIVGSEVLKSSDSLCRLLRYLGTYAVEHPGVPVKEYQIATEVFGRPATFDPKIDSTVRVQTGRLRSKLAEYYAAEGLEDDLIVEVPKGAYALAVHPRHAAIRHIEPAAPVVAAPPAAEIRQPGMAVMLLSLLSLSLGCTVLYLVFRRPPAAAAVEAAAPASLHQFWRGFIERGDQPWVVYSNAEFVGRPETGMRYFDSKRDDRNAILDHYTGVGEVLAIHEMDRLFAQFKHPLRVKRGRLLALDDVKNNDVVFLGSPTENLTLRDIPTTREFVFRLTRDKPRAGDLAIVNLKPQAGEPTMFLGSPRVPIDEDYALIGLVPGMTAGRWVMILAGTTTIGTQAAAEFVCRASQVEQLVRRAGLSSSGQMNPFEAVLRVKVSHGVPVSSDLVAVHANPH